MRVSRISRLQRGHIEPTPPKFVDKPGIWGPTGGPVKDTLSRRTLFYRMVLMNKIGRLTKPFRTPKVQWAWRKLQLRAWKTSVFVILFMCLLCVINLWVSFVYHAYAIGPTTPVIERKIREHRVSKQVLQMVRERERDITQESEIQAARATPSQ